MTVDQHALACLMGLSGGALHVVDHGEPLGGVPTGREGRGHRRRHRGNGGGGDRGGRHCGGRGGGRGRNPDGGRGRLGAPRGVRRGQCPGTAGGRVEPAVVLAVDLHGHPGFVLLGCCCGWLVRRPQVVVVQRDPPDGEPAEGVVQGGGSVASPAVQRDRQVRAVAEDLPDEAGERVTGADLDERPHARGVHRLDLVAEQHG